MKAILHSKLSLDWDGNPERFEYECKSVKVIGKKIEIFINEYNKVIWNVDRCDLEIVD